MAWCRETSVMQHQVGELRDHELVNKMGPHLHISLRPKHSCRLTPLSQLPISISRSPTFSEPIEPTPLPASSVSPKNTTVSTFIAPIFLNSREFSVPARFWKPVTVAPGKKQLTTTPVPAT